MNMRNHWLEIESTSLKNGYATGPKGKKDEMTLTLYQNNDNTSEEVLKIECFPLSSNDSKEVMVVTRVTNQLTGQIIFYHETIR